MFIEKKKERGEIKIVAREESGESACYYCNGCFSSGAFLFHVWNYLYAAICAFLNKYLLLVARAPNNHNTLFYKFLC